MKRSFSSIFHLTFLLILLLVSGCEQTIEEEIVESLVQSEYAIERKMGEVMLNQLPKEPIAVQTFAWIPMDGKPSRGFIALARGENMFVSEVFEKGGLYHYTKFQFFPDTILKVSLRSFAEIAGSELEPCAPLKHSDPVLSTSFYGNNAFHAFSNRYYSEISCNAENDRALMLTALSNKFEVIPPRKE